MSRARPVTRLARFSRDLGYMVKGVDHMRRASPGSRAGSLWRAGTHYIAFTWKFVARSGRLKIIYLACENHCLRLRNSIVFKKSYSHITTIHLIVYIVLKKYRHAQ